MEFRAFSFSCKHFMVSGSLLISFDCMLEINCDDREEGWRVPQAAEAEEMERISSDQRLSHVWISLIRS